MSTRVQQSVIINRPVEQVFAYISDYRNAPRWQRTILENQVTPEGPAQEGMRVTDVRTFIGYKIQSAYKITELEPNVQVSFESMSGPFPYHGSIFFKPLDNATWLMYELVIEAKGFFKLTGSMLASSMKQEVAISFDLLKRLLEAGE